MHNSGSMMILHPTPPSAKTFLLIPEEIDIGKKSPAMENWLILHTAMYNSALPKSHSLVMGYIESPGADLLWLSF
jgi:hypothetical protein